MLSSESLRPGRWRLSAMAVEDSLVTLVVLWPKSELAEAEVDQLL